MTAAYFVWLTARGVLNKHVGALKVFSALFCLEPIVTIIEAYKKNAWNNSG